MNVVTTLPTWLKRDDDTVFSSKPSGLKDFQQKQWQVFIERGLPTRSNERWKYADLTLLTHKHFSAPTRTPAQEWQKKLGSYRLAESDSILLVFMNGYFMPEHSDLAKLPPHVIALSLVEALKHYPALVEAHWPQEVNALQYPFANLNAARFEDGLFLYVPDQCELAAPIHLLSLVSDHHEFIAHPHHLIVLGHRAKLKCVEEYEALSALPYFMNITTNIAVGREAELDYCKIQNENSKAIHIAHTFIKQQQNSEIAFTSFSSGSLFAHDEVNVKLLESGANCRTAGFYRLSEENQYRNHHVDIYHAAPHSKSEMLYKGIVDKKSRAVFNGKLHVEKNAQKILAYQENHNLLLSKEAEVYSKPELEIYADDVKCKHGASTGQIDETALFYLCSRGISYQEAFDMLLKAFAEDILLRITHPGIKRRVKELSC